MYYYNPELDIIAEASFAENKIFSIFIEDDFMRVKTFILSKQWLLLSN